MLTRTPKTKLLKLLKITIVFSLLVSCKWSNLKEFKSNCEDHFSSYLKVYRDTNSGKIKFNEPLLTPKDIKLVSKKEPSKLIKSDNKHKALFHCKRTKKGAPSKDDLIFYVHYNSDNKMNTFEFPRQFCEMFPNDDQSLNTMIQKILQAELSLWGKELNNTIKCKKNTKPLLPHYKDIIRVYGPADNPSTNQLTYNYSVLADPKDTSAEKAGRKVQIIFKFNEQKQISEIKFTLSSTIITLDVEYQKN